MTIHNRRYDDPHSQANFAAVLVCLAVAFILFVWVLPTVIDKELAYTEAGLEQSISKAQRLEIMEAHK